MGRSSSDSDSSYRRKKSKKKHSRRSRSRSSSYEKSHRSKSSRSSRKRSRSRDRRSRSRERRSRSRDRRSHSRSRSRDRRSPSHDYGSHSSDKRSRSRDKRRDKRSRSRSPQDAKYKQRSVSPVKSQWDVVLNRDESALLDNKVKDLNIYKPSAEDIAKIDQENFVQQKFSASFNPAQMPPTKQKKKKKKKQQLRQQQQLALKEELTSITVKAEQHENISHENAIFGTTADSMHLGKFSSHISSERQEKLKKIESNDLIFGPMFCEDPDLRMKRWIEKLTSLRQKLRIEKKV